MTTDAIIEARRLNRTFGKLVAVRDVSLSVDRGEIYGVLGPNGAGKSTTIRMLCGILDPTGGEGRVVGFDIRKQGERIKSQIGYMTQKFSLYDDLTVVENFDFYGGIYGIPFKARRRRIEETVERAGLQDRRHQLVGTLSGGWKQRVALASAMLHEPPLLFLDEPTAGVDPVSRRAFWDQIHVIASHGTTVLVTTHYMDEAERCHRLAFIFRGSVLDVGTPQEVVARRRLRVAEVVTARARDAARVLRPLESIDEVSHFGGTLRVAVRDGADPVQLTRRALEEADIPYAEVTEGRATVEDAFVSMVREDTAAS